jgi:hypothetical protein
VCGMLVPMPLLTSSSGAMIPAVRPTRPNGHRPAWEALAGHDEQTGGWVTEIGAGKAGRALTLWEVDELLSPSGLPGAVPDVAPLRDEAVRIADVEPGVECQIDSRSWVRGQPSLLLL